MPVGRDGSICDAGFRVCLASADGHPFKRHRGAGLQLGWKPVDRNRSGFSFGDDMDPAVAADQQCLGVVRTIRIRGVKDIRDRGRSARAVRFGQAIDRDALPSGFVVADVPNMQT